MTWKELNQQQYRVTEREYNRLIREYLASYQTAYNTTRDRLQAVYANILSGVDPKEYINEMYKFNRINKLLKQIDEAYREAARKTGQGILQANSLNVSNMYYRSIYALSWTGQIIEPVLNSNLVEASIFGTAEKWRELSNQAQIKYRSMLPQYGSLSQLLNDRSKENLDNIRRTMTQAFIQGDSYTKAAKRIRGAFNTAAYQAERIARTEGTRNLNAGSYMATEDARAQGLEIIRQWDATLDTRTRQTHAQADGQREDTNGQFHVGGAAGPYPGNLSTAGENANCRCGVLELPVDADGNVFTPELRRARDPVKEMQWENASASEKRNRELKDGTKIYPRSQQTVIISNTSFTEWMKMNNLSYRNGKIVSN